MKIKWNNIGVLILVIMLFRLFFWLRANMMVDVNGYFERMPYGTEFGAMLSFAFILMAIIIIIKILGGDDK